LNKDGVYIVYSGKETMKAEILTLTAAMVIGTSQMSAQSKLQVIGVNQVLTNPDEYHGKIVALHGIVQKVALEQRTFTIVDSKSGSNIRGANVQSLPATIRSGSQIDTPQAGQEAIVLGQVEKKDGVANFMATQVFTNRAEVQQLLAHGSITRTPGKRPGDNLGRDAQPSRDQ
jgi:hypothetical protein